MSAIRSICVYCGSSPGRDPVYRESALVLGRSMAHAGIRLVYGGGTKGIMGAVADGVMDGGGKVTGIIPRFLLNKEGRAEELRSIDELIVTEDMHTRKHTMFERSDAFVTLPGGIGTVEEIVEIMTWAQLGRHRKPMVFANIAGFWDPMLALMDHMRAEGFIHTAHLVKPLVVADPAHIVAAVIDATAGLAEPEGVEEIIERM
jgi:hypothetical protein